MKFRIFTCVVIAAGLAMLAIVAVAVFGSTLSGFPGCALPRPDYRWPGQTSEVSRPIVVGKVVKIKTNADGSIGIDSSADNNMQYNFDIENPEGLGMDARSN